MGKKIKVLFAINCMNIGGAPTVVYEQMKNIDKEKFDPYLLTLYPSKKANFFGKLDFLEKEKIVEFNLKNRSPFDVKTLRQIYKYLRKEKFDIVYTHLFLANLLVRFLSVLARVPVIFSFEHSTYFDKKKWQIIADKILSKFTSKIIVSTNTVLDFTSEQEGIEKQKFFVIPNTISLPDKSTIDKSELKREFDIPEDNFVVMSLGRFSEEKAQKLFIAAAEKALQKNNITFLLIGHGPQRDALKEEVKKRSLEENFRIIEEPERAKEFYLIGDIFVLTSIREGQSIVTYEAMEAGLPVVVPDLSTLKEIVKDEYNGLLFPVGNVDKISECIMRLYRNSELREKLKANGKQSVEPFKIEKSIIKLEDLLFNAFIKKNEKT